jgi:hypothetical protein
VKSAACSTKNLNARRTRDEASSSRTICSGAVAIAVGNI